VNKGDTNFDEFLLPEEQLTLVCAGLIRIDHQGGTVRWIHETARVCFEKHSRKQLFSSVCVTYLPFDTFESGPCKTPEEFEQRLDASPLFHYAATTWGLHLPPEMISDSLVSNFLANGAQVEAAGQCLLAQRPRDYESYGLENSFKMTAVHISAYFGLFDAVEEKLPKGYKPDGNDSARNTPLSYAAKHGYPEVMDLLLANDVDPDAGYSR